MQQVAVVYAFELAEQLATIHLFLLLTGGQIDPITAATLEFVDMMLECADPFDIMLVPVEIILILQHIFH